MPADYSEFDGVGVFGTGRTLKPLNSVIFCGPVSFFLQMKLYVGIVAAAFVHVRVPFASAAVSKSKSDCAAFALLSKNECTDTPK